MTSPPPPPDEQPRQDSRVILGFLRRTDYPLLTRIARRMINHLCWGGVDEAHELLQRFTLDRRGGAGASRPDENRPIERQSPDTLARFIDDAFALASTVLSEAEIVACLERWIKDDKTGFLIEASENQTTSLAQLSDALERFREMGISDTELSASTRNVLRVSLARRFLTDDLHFIRSAKNCIEVQDFCDLVPHVISPPLSRGKLGGKSSGLLLAKHIVRTAAAHDPDLVDIRVPKTYYVTTDGVLDFIEHNHLQDVYDRKYLPIEQVRREYSHIVQVFKNSHFTPGIMKGLSVALDDLGDHPIIVRSSSLLEDRFGTAFSGKYKSLFLANLGSKTERLGALMDAIAEVYASVFGPDPIEYRGERGLLDVHEEMGVMIQQVVGRRAGRYFLPAYAGVAFSRNEFRWSPRIRRDDGLVRLVVGLGTRAVDRVGDDFPILAAPGQPGLRVNTTADEMFRYSPHYVDVINLEAGEFQTLALDQLVREVGHDLPGARLLLAVWDESGLPRPVHMGWDPGSERAVATFEGLLSRSPFLARMRALLHLLAERIGGPVDLEFASDGTTLYLLQCRPQSYGTDEEASPLPADVPHDRVVFTANCYVSNGRLGDIRYIVYVDPEGYAALPDLASLRSVGHAVSALNRALPRRQFLLIGPGRWGSRGDVKLGVSVTYSDISNTAMLVEMARRGGSAPDVSFGTHFFQDLVESGIRYLPLFPGSAGTEFNEGFLRTSPNSLADLAPEWAHLAGVVRVIDVVAATGGLVLKVLLNADADRALAMLAPPARWGVTLTGSGLESDGVRPRHFPDLTPYNGPR